jgi:hypothetical protein
MKKSYVTELYHLLNYNHILVVKSETTTTTATATSTAAATSGGYALILFATVVELQMF